MTPGGRGRTAGWALLALAGIAVAVALSLAASSLSTQPIGLSGEPLRAGDRLAPAEPVVKPAAKPKAKRKPAKSPRRPSTTATATTPVPTQTTVTPVPAPTQTSTSDDGSIEPGDDHGGSSGRSGSDD